MVTILSSQSSNAVGNVSSHTAINKEYADYLKMKLRAQLFLQKRKDEQNTVRTNNLKKYSGKSFTQPSSTSKASQSNTKKHGFKTNVEPFTCQDCTYSTNSKFCLQLHTRMHDVVERGKIPDSFERSKQLLQKIFNSTKTTQPVPKCSETKHKHRKTKIVVPQSSDDVEIVDDVNTVKRKSCPGVTEDLIGTSHIEKYRRDSDM